MKQFSRLFAIFVIINELEMIRLKLVLAALIAMVGITASAQSALDIIHARKSVRTYTDENVSEEQVETILRAAMAAP